MTDADRPTVPIGIPVDLERAPILLGEEPVVQVAPTREPRTPGEWIHDNLFSTVFNGTLTIVTAAIAGYVGLLLFEWFFATSEWDVIRRFLRLYMVGRFPEEEVWRVWAAGYFVAVLAGLSWGASGKRLGWTPRKTAVRAVFGALSLLVLVGLLQGTSTGPNPAPPAGLVVWSLIAGLAVAYGAGLTAGRLGGRGLRRVVLVGWALAFPVVILLLRAFGGVSPPRWGGFLLNIILAVVAIFLSFPIGILLALGRRSSLPVIRTFCVGFIELIRGVPLITLLFFGQYLLPLLLADRGSAPVPIVRAMAMMTIFSSAYVAEIVRGGLQGVDAGQFEAARALGLSTTRMMALVVLPQALRSTIPSMISHFISLFKDTSLIAVIGGIDMLRVARLAPQDIFQGAKQEAFVVAAALFWVVAFSMSRWSQRLEARLGVGER